MKWLWIPLLWLAAMAVAVAVLYRIWRGHNVVLKGRWSPHFVRMIVVVLVVLGFGVEKSPAAPVPGRGAADKPSSGPASADWPKGVTPEVVGAWLFHQQPTSPWMTAKQEFIKATLTTAPMEADPAQGPGRPPGGVGQFAFGGGAVPPVPRAISTLMTKHRNDIQAGKEATTFRPPAALQMLDEMEQAGLFDHWASAYVWRLTNTDLRPDDDPKLLVELYARLHRHACLTNALLRAQAQVKPFAVMQRAWMGKAGRPPGFNAMGFDHVKSGALMHPTAVELFPKSDAGTWVKDGLVVLAVMRSSPGVVLIRNGTRQEINPGESFRLGRLDLIETPAGATVRLEHAWLGPIDLPAGKVVAARSLPSLLPEDAKTKVKQAAAEAVKGAEDPTTKLEQAQPLAHPAMREVLKQQPDLPGAPRLRLILSLFDDAVMPALAPVEAPKVVSPSLGQEDILDRGIAPHKR